MSAALAFLRRRREILVAAAIVIAAPALAATTVVTQRNRAFSVKSIEIARGDTVNFANDDEFIHQIFVDSKSMTFDSAEQNPGETIKLVFPTSGTFQVLCHIHPKMLLNVTVK